MIGRKVKVTVDRPLGSRHPEYTDMVYPVNYGYIVGIIAPDGEEQDAYILGVDHPVDTFTGKMIAIIRRSDDVEEKWVVCPEGMSFTADEIEQQVCFTEKYFAHEIITGSRPENFPDFMRAEKNIVPSDQQNTPDIKGYYYTGNDGSQTAFWEYSADSESKEHSHDYDEYMVSLSGEYTLILNGKETVLRPGDEMVIPKGQITHLFSFLRGFSCPRLFLWCLRFWL